jgi:predicted Zn-dependent protease
MQIYFTQLADAVCALPAPGGGDVGIDRILLNFSAEQSDFIRFNHARVRQATQVDQRFATVSVVAGLRRADGSLSLSGDLHRDTALLLAERATLIAQLPFIPEDPYLLLPEVVQDTERTEEGRLPNAVSVIEAVAAHAGDADFVGFYAGGGVQRAFADSRGQRNWHSVRSFNFEWCIYQAADKAVKAAYAGTEWRDEELAARIRDSAVRSALLAQPARVLSPGAYRVYFSPVAVADLLGTLSWGGFGLKAVRTGVSSLVLMHRDGLRLNAQVDLTEATATGTAPRFQGDGFVKPDTVPLVRAGHVADTLVSPRSAREYGMPTNAGAGESPEALALQPGDLPAAEVLQRLGTGVWISNLHYLNYSDRQACRVTGMTRFACWWVEDGRLVAPIQVMRFDDSLLRMFGEGLVALTDEAELVPDAATYSARQLGSVTAPGAIVDGFCLTL